MKIKLIVSDIDGVLTNGNIGYGSELNGQKFFNVKDGLAVKLLQSNGIVVAFISGGDSEATKKRAESLCINECHTNIIDKSKTIQDVQKRLELPPDSTLYLGDDINDLVVTPFISLFVAPQDCNYLVKRKANIILRKKGGEGVLREICDMILNLKGRNIKNLTQDLL